VFTNKKREGINTFDGAISIYVAETPKASINEHELPLPIISFGIVTYGFVGQPFSKQLFRTSRLTIPIVQIIKTPTHVFNSFCMQAKSCYICLLENHTNLLHI